MIEYQSYTTARLVALWTETVLFGINTVLFLISNYVLLSSKFGRRSRNSKINITLITAGIGMYMLCAGHVVIDFYRAIFAFAISPDPQTYYEQLWTWSSVLREGILATNTLVVDGLLIFRLYVVWGVHAKTVMIAPMIMWLTTAACGYRSVWGFADIKIGQDAWARQVFEWIVISFATSLTLNLVVTALLAGRIWWVGRKMDMSIGSRRMPNIFRQAIATFLESAALYTVFLFLILVMYAIKLDPIYTGVVFDMTAQIMGIAPNLIIVRVGLGISTYERRSAETSSSTPCFSDPWAESRSFPASIDSTAGKSQV